MTDASTSFVSKRLCEGDGDPTDESDNKRIKTSVGPAERSVQWPGLITEGSAKGAKIPSRRDATKWAHLQKGKDKDKKNAGRKSRRGTRSGEERPENVVKSTRLPKRQCALLIGFCGTGYNGMQIQPDVRTIEGVLFDAMVKAGAVSQDNADDPVKVNLGRAARTDAGVHAAGNVISIKMIISVPGVDDIVARINDELPSEIRVWNFVRVQNSFNARLSCDSRKYTYFFPTYLLIPPKPDSGLHRTLYRHTASSDAAQGLSAHVNQFDPFWIQAQAEPSTHEHDLMRKRQWRISSDQLGRLREAAQKFEATHNFHNFTVGRDFSDRSSKRHMKKIEVFDPVVYGETEWISVLFHGQSFMLHQRKMMSVLILTCRTGTPKQIIEELYGPRTVFVPKTPSLGLLLENPIFDSYNNKVAGINQKLQPSDEEYRPPIDFEIHREQMEKFKQQYIYDIMRTIEDRDGIFDAWVRSVDAYGGDDLLYLNPKGTIPAASVTKKGQKRDNPFREKKRFDSTNFPPREAKMDVGVPDDEEYDETVDRKLLVDLEG